MIYWELMDSGVKGVLLAHLWPGVYLMLSMIPDEMNAKITVNNEALVPNIRTIQKGVFVNL
jgi:hypothetical protein